MLEQFVLKMYGIVDARVQAHVAERLDAIFVDLVTTAIASWQAESFRRYSDGELSCTVRLYDWCERTVRQERARFPATRVQYEGSLPTAGMREGAEDPRRSPRPDLIISVGGVGVHLEAKLLKAMGRLPREYVDQGLRRILSGKYAWERGLRGAMISYSPWDAPVECVRRVNEIISEAPDLGPSQVLKLNAVHGQGLLQYASEHRLPYRIVHFAVDLR